MKEKNRFLRYIKAAILLVFVILAGCSSDSSTDGESKGGNKESNEGGAQADGKIAPDGITFSWIVGDRFEGPVRDDWRIFQEIEEKTGVKIDFQAVSTQALEERKQILIATNSVTDIIQVTNQEGREHGPEGIFLNLKEYLDIAPNLKKYFEENPEAEALATASDGGLYTVPTLESYEESKGFNYVWWARTDILEQNDLKSPENMQEFYELLLKLKASNPDSYPLTFQTPVRNDTGVFSVLTKPFTGIEGIINFDPKQEKYVFAPYHENFMDSLIYINKLYEEQLLDPEFALLTRDQWSERITSGKSFITYFWKADIPAINDIGKTAVGDQYNIGVIPPFAEKDEYNFQFSRPSFGGSGFALSAKVKDKEKAVRFLDYLVSEEGRNYLSLGIEGETYTFEDGKPMYNKDFGPAPYNTLRKDYGVWYTAIVIDSAIARDAWENAMDDDFLAMQEMYQPYIIPAPRNFVRTEEEMDLEKSKLDNLNQYLEQELTKFVMGEIPINEDNFNKFISQAQRLGVDEIINMYNTAYHRTYGSE